MCIETIVTIISVSPVIFQATLIPCNQTIITKIAVTILIRVHKYDSDDNIGQPGYIPSYTDTVQSHYNTNDSSAYT